MLLSSFALLSFSGFIYGVLWFLLIVVMVVMIGVILLQEGKGGGLAEAFGGAGAETFGVKAHGINKFTAVLGVVFLVLCVILTKFDHQPASENLIPGFTPAAESPDPNSPDAMLRALGVPPAGGSAPAGGAPPGSSGAPAGGGGATDGPGRE
ncbi:MAG: preprotein translocase subunit SecG [Planctomycetes bacterium]|nr:preprotein translocase subunit SecG [Planctomycetota bacterium]